MAAIVTGAFDEPKPWMWASLSFPVYYFILSWWITVRRWRGRRRPQEALAFAAAPALDARLEAVPEE
jgi:hypothetical protein